MKIELFKAYCGYTVIVNDKFASRLTKDEALGVVASALFSKEPIFVRTYEEWLQWNRRVAALPMDDPVALLPDAL